MRVQERQRGATPRPRSGAAAKRRYPESEVKGDGLEEPPCVQGQGQHPRPGEVARRNNPTPKARAATERSNPTPKE